MFRMNGYVQDERYIAREHMDVRRDCVSFARCMVQDVRRDCVNFAHCIIAGVAPLRFAQNFISAWAPRSQGTFLSDSPQARPCGLGRDIHVAHGPKVRYLTPSATWVITREWFLTDGPPASVVCRTCLLETTVFNLPTESRGCGPCFRTVRDRKSSPRPHGRACGMS
jgi:hypothetical protein